MALAFLAALAVIALRLLLHTLGRPPQGMDFMLVHFLAIVTVVFFAGLRLLRSDAHAGFPQLMREGFRAASLYALLSGLFLWLYFTFVDDRSFAERVEALVRRAAEEGHPEEVMRPRLERFFTPFNYATISFVALFAAGALNALLIGLFHHKLLRGLRR